MPTIDIYNILLLLLFMKSPEKKFIQVLPYYLSTFRKNIVLMY